MPPQYWTFIRGIFSWGMLKMVVICTAEIGTLLFFGSWYITNEYPPVLLIVLLSLVPAIQVGLTAYTLRDQRKRLKERLEEQRRKRQRVDN